MDEKTMVSDALWGINGELKFFGDVIAQTEEPSLKQTLKQMRNKCEMSQEELYQIARATDEEVAHVRSLFTQSSVM